MDLFVASIQVKYVSTLAAILLLFLIIYFLYRYQIERGNIVIPKSVNKSRIASNFDVFNFSLSKEDVELIDSFDCNGRFVPMLA